MMFLKSTKQKILVVFCVLSIVICAAVISNSPLSTWRSSEHSMPVQQLHHKSFNDQSHHMNDFDHAWGAVISNYHLSPEPAHFFPLVDINKADNQLNDGRRRRILIVTSELAGLTHNGKTIPSLPHGGAGTANLLLARLLAQHHSVSILHISLHSVDVNIKHSVTQSFYLSTNVRLLSFPDEVINVDCGNTYSICSSYRVFLFLQMQSQQYDIVHFNDYGGHGYYSALAKSQKWALQNTQLVVTCHGTSQWASMINNIYPQSVEQLESFFLERKTIELSDVLISPSHYILNYYAKRGIVLPQKTYMVPNPQDKSIDVVKRHSHGINEICFFGRLEMRKGLILFAAAVDRLVREMDDREQSFIISFVGRDTNERTLGSLKHHLETNYIPGWITSGKVNAVYFHDRMSRESALSYLSASGRLAVIPSLTDNSPYTVFEAVQHSISFIASDVGGVPEIVHPDDRAKVFFRPTAAGLSKKLHEVLTARSIDKARPAISAENIDQMHIVLNNQLIAQANVTQNVFQHDSPLVSVCVTHYQRSDMLMSTLLAVAAQTYKNLQVIVLDDGSNEAHRHVVKEKILPMVIEQNWRMLFFENSYLGSARNKCRKFMTGKYLVFFDDDDLPKPTFVERVVQTAEAMQLDVVSTHFQIFPGILKPSVNPATYFDFEKTKLGWPSPASPFQPSDLVNNAKRIYGHDFIRQAVFPFVGQSLMLGTFKNVYGGANLFIRGDVYDNLHGFSEYRNIGFEDYELLTRATVAGYKHQLIPDPLYLVRSSSKSMQSSTESFYNYDRVLTALANKFTSEDAAQDTSMMIYYVHGLIRSHQNSLAEQHSLIASSLTQFSGEAGQFGWYYGFYRLYSNSEESIAYNRSDFIPAISVVDQGRVRWQLHDRTSSSHSHHDHNPFVPADSCPICTFGVSWPEISTDHMHPFVADRMSLAAVRRWVSYYAGDVVLDLKIYVDNPRQCGDGVSYHVLRNGQLIWSARESDSQIQQVRREISAKATIGETFDFVVTAGHTDHCDATRFDVVIRKQ